MLTKTDVMSLLIKLEGKGINIDSYLAKLAISKEIPIEILKFIASYQGIEVVNFYDMLRKKHNQNKSPLYTNLLKEDVSINEALVTLSALLTQIALYNKNLESDAQFLKEARAEEISRALNTYYKDGTTSLCFNLLNLIKTDILVLDYINGRRELN